MKKKYFTIAFAFLSLALLDPSHAITKDDLWGALTFSDTQKSIEEARRLALENPNILEEIIFLSDSEKDNSVARFNSIVHLETCSLTGIITKERFFNNIFRLLSQITNYVHPLRLENDKKNIIAIMSNYSGKQDNPLLNLSTLLSILDSMFSNNLIKNEGIFKSLKSKISNAKDFFEKKPNLKNPIINKIQAAINEAEAQRGKHLTEEAYLVFSAYCNNVIVQIQNTN